jgi:hypothetical protein
MSKQIESNSHYCFFLVKSAACVFSLLFGFFILAPTVSMQDDEDAAPMTNTNMRMMANYKATPEPPKSSVRGRVIYADTGRAVRRAGLLLMSAKGTGGGKESAGLTNERGEFEIKDVTAGRYYISVSTPGVLTPFSSLTNFQKMGMQDSSTMADVAKDFQEIIVNGINDTDVTVVAKRGAAITGRIMYADGEAAIGVRVEVLRKKDGQYNAVVPNLTEIFGAIFGGAGGLKTDDRGVFRVAGLPAGDYLVRVVENVSHGEKGSNRDDEFMVMSGFNPGSMVTTYYPNTDDMKKAETIKIEIGQEQSEINITIPERTLHNFSGTVINKATREPLKNANVSLKRQDKVNSLFSSMRGDFGSKNETDEKGRWNYKELPAGKYILIVQPPHVNESSGEKNTPKPKTQKLSSYEKEIIIGEKDTSDLIVELGYGAIVSGKVTVENGQNLPAQTIVSIIEEKGKTSESDSLGGVTYDDDSRPKTTPKKSADFKIDGLPNGKFYFNISAGSVYGENEKKEEFYVKSILYAGKNITDAMLEVKEGEELKDVQIVLSKDVGKIKGKVINSDKTPAVGAKINFVSIDKQKWGSFNSTLSASTDAEGDFEISGAPGEYFIFFLKDEDFNEQEGGNIAENRRSWLEKKSKDAKKVILKAKETEKVTLVLSENQ